MKKQQRLSRSGSLFLAVFTPLILLAVMSQFVNAQEPVPDPPPPETMPDGISGFELYQSRCVVCHGPLGAGDGEMAVNLPTPPRMLNDPEFRRTAVPAAMFTQIDQGNLETGMPPFGAANTNDPLNPDSIWNLVAAVYSLSTPPDAIAQGEVVYQQNCLACHGAQGQGDGPEAGDMNAAGLDLTRLDYWFGQTNEMVFASLDSGDIPEHTYTLSEDEQWQVVDYARTFSYVNFDPQAPLPLIETAVISGVVDNGTTGELMPGLLAQLRAFTTSFEQTLNMTTTVGADGVYQFDLEEVDSDWVYLVSIRYNDLSFSSDANQLSRVDPALSLPVTVFEKTNDSGVVNVEQMHLVFEFFDGMVDVTELYVFSNADTAVFVGPSGIPEEGTIEIRLPEQAENVSFERTFGALQNTVPANEVIQTAVGYADTLPLRPGQGVLSLIVRYTLPYDDGLDFAHELLYDTPSITAIIPGSGVTIEGDDWLGGSPQSLPDGGTFVSYQRQGIAAGGELLVALDGRPQLILNPDGTSANDTNDTISIIIGAGVFLIAIGVVFYVLRAWRSGPAGDDDFDEAFDEPGVYSEEELIQAIVNLDESFESGQLDEPAYRAQRASLKADLKALWQDR